MFTGLIEEVGTMQGVTKRGEAMILHIRAKKVLEGIALGDSIAVNGVCLTAVAYDRTSFMVDVMPQTYRNTNLKELSPGSPVNLERAMAANGRFGGHIVQGHVDGIAQITRRTQDHNAVVFEFKAERADLGKYLIPKGSITIDGISLTLTKAANGVFGVSIIPHTLAETALQNKHPGDTVNIECDILGKYVEHLLHYGNKQPDSEEDAPASSKLSMAFLADNGFM